jgi:hypothetical protein
MTPHSPSLSAARARLRAALVLATVALVAACDNSSGPRTGKLSLSVGGLPSSTAAKVTLKGPNGFTRALTGTEVVASLKPGNYSIIAESVRDGLTRYSPLADSQAVTITKSDVPVEASIAYAVSSATLTVTLTGSPTGAPAAVRITGPQSFSQTIAQTTTFEGIEPGVYFIVAPEITADQQRYSANRPSQQVQLSAGLNATNVPISYAQITGNLTFVVTGLPSGVAGDISVTGPAQSYVVGASGDLIGVRAGQYTVNVKPVQSGATSYVPSFSGQTVTLQAGATAVVTVNYASSDGPLNLTIDGVTLTQVVQTYSGTVPLVAGRDAFIRVFARANQQNTATAQVRVRFFVGEALVHTMNLTNSATVPLTADQSALTSSWNGIVLGQFIQPGLKILAEVDPANTVVEASETDNAFPANGTPAVITVKDVPPLRITFVPVVQRFDKALVGNVTDANKDQFLIDARRLLPLRDIDAQVHAPYTTADSIEITSNDGNQEWLRILNEMNALRIAESSTRNYFGVVKVSYNAGVAGYGYVPGRAAVGWDYLPSGRNVAAHELGHNFSRFHAPCGGVGGPDPNFPYAGGTIGVYGYDFTSGTVRLPSSADLMGYCNSPWISDYNYVGAMDWRQTNPSPDVASASLGRVQDASPRPSLLVWGRVERGELVLEPAFSLVTRPSVPRETGPYRVEGIARNGRTLFSYSFAGERPADAEDATARHFAFAIPMDEATQGELASIRLTGGGARAATMQAGVAPGGVAAAVNAVDATVGASGSINVRWGAGTARMALIRDRATGQVLSFARGGSASVRARSGDIEVTVSDGVRSASRVISARNR